MNYISEFIASFNKTRKELSTSIAFLTSAVHEQTKTISETSNAAQKRSETQPVIRAVLEVPDTIKTKQETTEREKWRKRWHTFVETGTLVTLVAYTIISHSQWKQMIVANDTTNRSIQHADLNFTREHRAWIMFDTDDADKTEPIVGRVIQIPVQLKNIGSTPATDVEGFIVADELKPTEEPEFDPAPIYRVAKIKTGAFYPQTPNTTRLPIRLIHQGTVIKIHGRLTYHDIFQNEHWVQFCHVISNSLESKSPKCVEYNKIDEEKRP